MFQNLSQQNNTSTKFVTEKSGKKFVYLPREEVTFKDNQLAIMRGDNIQLKSDLNKALSKLLKIETKILK